MRLDAKFRSHFEPTEAPELGGTRTSCGDGGEAAAAAAAAAEPGTEPQIERGSGCSSGCSSGSGSGLGLGLGSGSELGLAGSDDGDGTWSWRWGWQTEQPRRQKRVLLAREGGGSVWNMTGMGLARGRCGRSRSLEALWLSWRAVKVVEERCWGCQGRPRAAKGLREAPSRPSNAGRGEIGARQGPRASRKHQCPSSLLRDKKGEDPRVVGARAGGATGSMDTGQDSTGTGAGW
ncbi:hypothetical protein J3F83DRAFT_113000 [Trichoderma novae-zelandiae]